MESAGADPAEDRVGLGFEGWDHVLQDQDGDGPVGVGQPVDPGAARSKSIEIRRDRGQPGGGRLGLREPGLRGGLPRSCGAELALGLSQGRLLLAP